MIKIDVNDVPSILELAGRIPPDIREALESWEAPARAAYVHGLLARAASQPPEAAEKDRTMATRVLEALPSADYLTRLAYLDTELQRAAREEDFGECGRLFAAICRLQAHSPQVPHDVVSSLEPGVAAEMAFADKAASRAAGVA